MLKPHSLFPALLFSAAFIPAALAAHVHVPAPSTWTLNVAKCDFGGGPALKGDIDHVLVDNDKQLHWEDVTTDANGQASKTSWDGPEDGTLHPIEGFPGGKFSWNTADDSERTVFPDGTVYSAILTLSPDQKTQTFHQNIKQADGKVYHQVLVYDRIK